MAESMDADSVYVELAEFVKKLDELKETLIDREMLLVDQLEVTTHAQLFRFTLPPIIHGDAKSPDYCPCIVDQQVPSRTVARDFDRWSLPILGRPFVKRFALSYRTVVCPVCPVCNVGVL